MYGTYMGTAATRAEVPKAYTGGTIGNADAENTVDLKKARFGVFSYFTGATDYDRTTPTSLAPNFMYNQEIKYDNQSPGYWTYDPVKYWPNGVDADNVGDPSYTAAQANSGKLSFFAVAPFTETPETEYSAGADGTRPTAIASDDNVKKNAADKGIIAMTTNTFTGNVWVKYLMPNASAATAVDLLWGLAGKSTYDEADGQDLALTIGDSYNINLTKQTVPERVKFYFKHALAKIGGATNSGNEETTTGDPAQCGFKVVVDVDGNNTTSAAGIDNQSNYQFSSFTNNKTLVTIKSVSIEDGATAATNNHAADGTKSDLATSGWFNIETGTWDATNTPAAGGASYSITANNDATLTNDTYLLNEKILEIGAGKSDAAGSVKKLKDTEGKEWSTANPTGVTTELQNVFANENVPGLLLIPGSEATLYVTVDYFVRTADPNLNAGYSEVEQVITNKVSLGSLQPNKYYTLVMHLGLTSVKFEAIVTDWTMSSDATFNEDGTVNESSTENVKKVWLPSNVVSANSWDITKSKDPYDAKGGDMTLTVKINDNTLDYAAAAASGKYTLAEVVDADWLSIDGTGKLTATANTTADKRTAIVNVSTIVNGNTITTPITVVQNAFTLANTTASGATVTVKDGDNQNVTSGYTVTVSGGDGKATETHSEQTITVTGTAGQTYNVTVTCNGVTKTVTVTIPTT